MQEDHKFEASLDYIALSKKTKTRQILKKSQYGLIPILSKNQFEKNKITDNNEGLAEWLKQ
jgi:hypothetical protein